MRNFIFLIIFSLLFVNLTSAQEVNTTSLKTNCINLTVSLKQGNRSSNVVVLQNFLREKGYLNAPATGFFGAQTLKAVKNFQKDNNINATGFIGPVTRAFINNLTCITTTNENTSQNEVPNQNTNATNTETNTNQNVINVETPITPVVDEVLTSNNSGSLRVRTDGVISMYNNSIVVRGMITQGAKNGIVRWFELTKNANEYKKSETKVTPNVDERVNNKKFEDTFTNLDSQTTYYFRACAGNVSLGQRSCGSTTTVKTN
jgi:peptidoglycan hydrolase-like protein with peptidoglycan-binding domain